jgi:hypothetical protein
MKIDPRTYWNINYDDNLQYMLGVQPPGYTPQAGALFSFGWYLTDLAGEYLANQTVNVRSADPANHLPYLMLRANGDPTMEDAYHSQFQLSGSSPDYSCSGTKVVSNAHWTVTYSPNQTPAPPPRVVARARPNQYYPVPGYSGLSLRATFDEVNGVNDEYKEDWYFAQNVGPILIHTHIQGTLVPNTIAWQRIKLVSYEPGSGVPGPGGVTLRDALIANAGTTSGLSFYSWNYYFQGVGHIIGIDPSWACVTNPNNPMTVDAYLSALETIGGSCGALSYPNLSNGSNPNSVISSMVATAGAAARLKWDQWNYYLTAVSGIAGQAPENVCMPTVMGVVPDRYLLLTPRQWLLFYEHYYMPTTFACGS